MAAIKQVVVLLVTAMASLVAAYVEQDLEKLQYYNRLLEQQLMNQQMFIEERLRSEGSSGIKQVRQTGQGSKSFYSNSHVGHSFMGMSNRANFDNRVGMDSVEAVLNGVSFVTRTNDYTLRKPHSMSNLFGSTEDIAFPDVPPAVLAKASVPEQIAEMQEWFKAFKDQDYSVRDYRDYFKPILCYIEGAWVKQENGNVHELSDSEKSFLGAGDWSEFHRKSEFTAYTGTNGMFDDYASLPKKVIDVVNDTNVVFAQWNYRILCHPLDNDVPTNRFVLEDDLSRRIIYKHTLAKHGETTEARYRMCAEDKDDCAEDGFYYWGYIDELMYQVPGMDNYPGQVTDDVKRIAKHAKDGGDLNAARYHRIFKAPAGAMGRTERYRGFADVAGYMAMTTNPNIPGVVMKDECKFLTEDNLECNAEYFQRWTTATPLEIIYLTPLKKWNPYNIPDSADPTDGGSRNGGSTAATAYHGASSNLFFRTPAAFFSGDEANQGPSDTVSGAVGVLDGSGDVQQVLASGVRIFLPEIATVGKIRQRYPIAAVHGEGSQAWKELNAFRELITHSYDRSDLFLTESKRNMTFMTAVAWPDLSNGIVAHTHELFATSDQVHDLKFGQTIPITTSPSTAGPSHTHALDVRYYAGSENYVYLTCDGSSTCHHVKPLIVVTKSLCS